MEDVVLTEELLEEYGFKRSSDKTVKEYIYTNDIYIVNILFIESDNEVVISLFDIYDSDKYISRIYIHLKELTLSTLQKAFNLFELELKIPLTFWIARNTDGLLYLYNKKPTKSSYGYHTSNTNDAFCIDDTLFPNITYECGSKKVLLKLID